MSKKLLIKFVILLILSISQILIINYKKPSKNVVDEEIIPVNYELVKNSLNKIDSLIIEKEEFEDDKIIVDTFLIGDKNEVENLIREINSNKFIGKVENISIEKFEEKWKWNGVIIFNSYTEYRNLHKIE